ARAQVQVQGRHIRDQQTRTVQRLEARDHLHVPATGITGRGALPGFLPADAQETQQVMVPRSAKGTEKTRRHPLRSTPTAAKVTSLLQTAKLSQQRTTAAGRTVAVFPVPAGAKRRQSGIEVSQHWKKSQAQDRSEQTRVQVQVVGLSTD